MVTTSIQGETSSVPCIVCARRLSTIEAGDYVSRHVISPCVMWHKPACDWCADPPHVTDLASEYYRHRQILLGARGGNWPVTTSSRLAGNTHICPHIYRSTAPASTIDYGPQKTSASSTLVPFLISTTPFYNHPIYRPSLQILWDAIH